MTVGQRIANKLLEMLPEEMVGEVIRLVNAELDDDDIRVMEVASRITEKRELLLSCYEGVWRATIVDRTMRENYLSIGQSRSPHTAIKRALASLDP